MCIRDRWVAGRLPVPSELLIIKTTGDKITDVPLAKVGTKAVSYTHLTLPTSDLV